MVKLATFLGPAILTALVSAAPGVKRDDDSIGDEVAVSAPNGTPITDTKELASQTAAEASASLASLASLSSATATSYVAYTTSTSDDSYDSSSSVYGYGYSSSTTTSSTYYVASTSTSDSIMSDSMTTSTDYSTSTYSTYASYSTASYGSGSSNWGSGDYNNCVQQCIASFGAPPATYTPPTTTSGSYGSDSSGSSGSGTTHTVIVAPSQGVLRYVPFATNASVGDTIMFMWGANMHTVTKSSELELCNKTDDAPFASGIQNKSFVFTQVVNTTDPTFFYCGVPTHCQKGMFGIINPPSALTSSNSVANMMPSIINNSSDVAAYSAYSSKMTEGNVRAAEWGNSIDMTNMPPDAASLVAENVFYVRNFLAANPDVLKDDGSIDLSGANGSPLMFPQDLNAVLASSSSSSAGNSAATASSGASSTAPSGTSAASSSNGARSLSSSTAVAGFVALVAAIFAL